MTAAAYDMTSSVQSFTETKNVFISTEE